MSYHGVREVRKQRVEAFTRAIKEGAIFTLDENGKPVQPSEPVGEYLGDVEVEDAFWEKLTNFNPFRNSIGAVPKGKYLLIADFDYAGDGHFIGMRLEPLREEANEEPALATAVMDV
jgi:hypothetical protein